MHDTLIATRHDAARGFAEPAPFAAVQADAEMELTDDELESVVGGLARVHLPGTVISSARAAA
ncbi:MAG TPA: hypothetical protein VEX86_16325 [Longimicrobium sp.]|nr:hypothetical protein [Longimicrobium sp.]